MGLLPGRLRLHALANYDLWLGHVDPEVLYMPLRLPRERRRVALDVGANQGVMTYFLARQFALVHAFEPNPSLTKGLRDGAATNVRIWPVAVSDQLGHFELQVPIVRGVNLDGWGSLEKQWFEELDGVESISVDTITIDSLQLDDVDFIKIDVERHELPVLKGTVQTLARFHPWISVEVWEPYRDEVVAFMNNQGYRHIRLPDLTGHAGSGANMVFIP